MHALIASARKSKRKLYCCFVDFKKAFDSVPRAKLWEVLAAKGITGDILKSIQSIYAQDEACVLTGEGLTDSFRCTTGVKQGCPASPLLFGLYIDEIEALLRGSQDRIDAPMLMQTMVAILLFADDIALFSHSAQGLQAQLDILLGFCQERGLKVNVGKTKVVVFEYRESESPEFLYDGAVVERVQIFKYLGICFHATRGMSCAMEYLCTAARKAMHAVLGRCFEIPIHAPQLKCMLFDALVQPILNYACEVWASVGGKNALEDLQRVELRFLKMLLGVPPNTSDRLVYAEFGRLPLRHTWAQQSLKYLDRVMRMDEGRLCKAAFLADTEHGLGWLLGLKDMLRSFDVRLPRSLDEFDLKTTGGELKDKAVVHGMTAVRGNHLEEAYFSFKTEFRYEPYISQAKNKHLRKEIALFRTGSHWLMVRKGRIDNIPYHKRLCPCCRVVDDEMHAIFHCTLYESERLAFADLFEGDQNLRFFLASNPVHRVALFLIACKHAQPARIQESRPVFDHALDRDGFVMDLTDFCDEFEADEFDSD